MGPFQEALSNFQESFFDWKNDIQKIAEEFTWIENTDLNRMKLQSALNQYCSKQTHLGNKLFHNNKPISRFEVERNSAARDSILDRYLIKDGKNVI